jgi:hypothetical protein
VQRRLRSEKNLCPAPASAFLSASFARIVALDQSGKTHRFWRLFFGSFLWTGKEMNRKTRGNAPHSISLDAAKKGKKIHDS